MLLKTALKSYKREKMARLGAQKWLKGICAEK
jgi:hypothetical protein